MKAHIGVSVGYVLTQNFFSRNAVEACELGL